MTRFTRGRQSPAGDRRKARWFLFHDNRILIEHIGADDVRPYFADPAALETDVVHRHYLGALNGIDCYAAELALEAPLPENTAFCSVRHLLGLIDEDLLGIVGQANHLVHWARNHRFCGRCGAHTREKTDERAMFCETCGLVNYPRVSPAVIVAVIKDRRILLARPRRLRANFYSVLAGFVEPGETLEECVRREVSEETGIRVKNIRYFGSQPWPFPDSLMVAFTAEHGGGELVVNPAEIRDAAWFAADELPRVPGKYSIARRLIDWFAG